MNLFTGLLFCSDCGLKLRGQVERRIRKDGSEYKNVSYLCGTYAHSGKSACTIHAISENALTELVVTHIRKHALMSECSEERIVETVLSVESNETMSYRAAYKSELKAHKMQLNKLDLLIENLFKDQLHGLIPDSLFKRQILKYEQDRVKRLQTVKTLEQRIQSIKLNTDDPPTWQNLMRQHTTLKSFDPETLLLLIDQIIINETQIVGEKRICDIKVIYNYIDDISHLTIGTKAEGVTEHEREVV